MNTIRRYENIAWIHNHHIIGTSEFDRKTKASRTQKFSVLIGQGSCRFRHSQIHSVAPTRFSWSVSPFPSGPALPCWHYLHSGTRADRCPALTSSRRGRSRWRSVSPSVHTLTPGKPTFGSHRVTCPFENQSRCRRRSYNDPSILGQLCPDHMGFW